MLFVVSPKWNNKQGRYGIEHHEDIEKHFIKSFYQLTGVSLYDFEPHCPVLYAGYEFIVSDAYIGFSNVSVEGLYKIGWLEYVVIHTDEDCLATDRT
jgi:hypothetical protein